MKLVSIGYFTKTHGVKGHLVMRVEYDFSAKEVKVFFIEKATGKAPYFISDLKESANGVLVLLEDIDAVEKAKPLIGKKIFIDSELLIKEEEEFNWLGYELIDKTYGSLGNISGITDNGAQILLSLTFKGKEIILPLVEAFIEKIEEKEKKIFFNAPEGLIDVYLEDSE